MEYSANKVWKKEQIEQVAYQFDQCTLPEKEWTHQAHLIVSAWNLYKLEYNQAVLKLKLGIARYNESLGNQNTIEHGYHETLTLFWTWAIAGYLDRMCEQNPYQYINDLIRSPFGDKYLPFFFYSEDLLFSAKARVMWVEPDMHDLNHEAILEDYPESIWRSNYVNQ
ncbi:MAG: hypothetical protein KJP00_13915 [Bacteroidia bacterium]|nr:hypothetical protein [Bacteroidia bacterium]